METNITSPEVKKLGRKNWDTDSDKNDKNYAFL